MSIIKLLECLNLVFKSTFNMDFTAYEVIATKRYIAKKKCLQNNNIISRLILHKSYTIIIARTFIELSIYFLQLFHIYLT